MFTLGFFGVCMRVCVRARVCVCVCVCMHVCKSSMLFHYFFSCNADDVETGVDRQIPPGGSLPRARLRNRGYVFGLWVSLSVTHFLGRLRN